MQGRLEWYCLDYWSAELSLDLRALKDASSHRVRFLPGAGEFLARLHASGKHVAVVTNAHGDALDMKKSVAGLGRYIDTFVSSHEFGAPKEGRRSGRQRRSGWASIRSRRCSSMTAARCWMLPAPTASAVPSA